MEKELEQDKDLDIHSMINKLVYYEENGKTKIKELLGTVTLGQVHCYRLKDPNTEIINVIPSNLIKLNLV